MIINDAFSVNKYAYLDAKFEKAYEFLRRKDLADLPAGKYEIDGEDVFAMVQEYETSPESELQFESHKKYFDIQYMIHGKEYFKMISTEGLKVKQPYDENSDVMFYEDPEDSSVAYLTDGQMAVVAPEEAHKPRCAAGQPEKVRKIVAKVRV